MLLHNLSAEKIKIRERGEQSHAIIVGPRRFDVSSTSLESILKPTMVSVGNGNNPCTNCLDRGQLCVASTSRRRLIKENAKDHASDNSDTADRLARIERLLQQATVGNTNFTPGFYGHLEGGSPSTLQLDPFGVVSAQPVQPPLESIHQSIKHPYPSMRAASCRTPGQQHDPTTRIPSRNLREITPKSNHDRFPNTSEAACLRLQSDDATPSTLYRCNGVGSSPGSSSYHHSPIDEGNSPDEIRERSSISSSETVSSLLFRIQYIHRMKLD